MENLNAIIEAANNGDAVSQYKLGRAYETGDGVTKDIGTARHWYQKSADNGYKNAEVKLRLLPVQDAPMVEANKEAVVKQAYQAPPAPAAFQMAGFDSAMEIPDAGQTEYIQKSKMTAAALALFFGWCGGHDFYLGHKKNGKTKIILTITVIGIMVSYIWSMLDLIKILCNGMFDSDGHPLQ